MHHPLVSIIVPNYNHFNYLKQRLDSIFNQTYQNFEVILLDDCSTDDSLQVLETYANHPKVSHFIINKQNSGSPFKQWVKGIELAKGDYIWIAESDDSNDLSFLDSCMLHAEQNINIGMVTTSLNIIDSDAKSVFTPMKNGFYNGKAVIETNMLHGNSFRNASGVVFLKQALNVKAISGLKYFKICGDWWLWVTILKSYNLYFLEPALTNYLKHEASTTNKLWDNKLFYQEVAVILKEIIKWGSCNRMVINHVVSSWILKLNHFDVEKVEKIKLLKKFRKLYSTNKKLHLIKVKICTFKTYKKLVKDTLKYFYNKQ